MYLKVFVTPNAKKDKLEKTTDGTFTLTVREPASGNRANVRVREMLAEYLRLPLGNVRILTGHRGRSKMISVDP